jgi:hypothetical protein
LLILRYLNQKVEKSISWIVAQATAAGSVWDVQWVVKRSSGGEVEEEAGFVVGVSDIILRRCCREVWFVVELAGVFWKNLEMGRYYSTAE